MVDLTFENRQPLYPNRYKVTDETGSSYYVTLERADVPTVEGTPLNADTLNLIVQGINNHTHTLSGLTDVVISSTEPSASQYKLWLKPLS